jgi:hypothetical protein
VTENSPSAWYANAITLSASAFESTGIASSQIGKLRHYGVYMLDAKPMRGVALMGVSTYEQGFIAATSGTMDEDDNPFPEGTGQHAEWLRGYMDGLAAARETEGGGA